MVNIVTYCTHSSIGSILQSYALKTVLFDLGYRSRIIVENETPNNNRLLTKKTVVKICERLLFANKKTIAKRKRIAFISNNIDVETFTDSIVNDDSLGEIYIAGSDQIWNPNKCLPLFFLDCFPNNKRISYAASMGKTEIPNEKKEIFTSMVNNFDVISVRERECAEVIGKLTDKNIEVNIDPTFLISVEKWRSVEKTYKINGKYILLYILYWDPKYKAQIKELKKKTGLPVYAITNGFTKAYADKWLLDVGVEEFLWLIDHAEYVITSSFHGAAFSTIFNKKFSCIINPALPSRISNLLETLSIPTISISDLWHGINIDYSVVNNRIKDEKQRSIDFLKRNLSK